MLSVRNLHAGYGPVEVLCGVDLDVAVGEIVAVLGANGAGKTTFNKTLSGLLRARAGTVLFDGEDIAAARADEIVQKGLVHVPEGRKIFPNLSVRENLLLGAYLRGRAGQAARLAGVLDVFVRLKDRLGQAAGLLSGGEQQMLAIGRGLMSDPRLLILDEPSLGLSPRLTEEMFALVARLNERGLPILIVEQNALQTLSIAHRAYVIEMGRVALAGTASQLLQDPKLKASYLGM